MTTTSYPVGQCTYGAAMLLSWIPAGLGNADQWVSNALGKGLQVSQTPVVGSAMVFDSGYPGSHGDGHVGVVTAIGTNNYPIIQEMNANRDGGGNGKYDTYQTGPNDASYVEGFILPAGAANPNPLTASQLANAGNPAGPLTGFLGFLSGNIVGQSETGSTLDLNPLDAFSGVWKTVANAVIKGGEVLLGAIIVIVGLYFIGKDAGAPGVGALGKLPGIAKMGAAFA